MAKKTAKSAKKSVKKSAKKKAAKRPAKRAGSSSVPTPVKKLVGGLSKGQIEDLMTLSTIITERKGLCMRIPKPTRLADNKWEVTAEDLEPLGPVTERAGPCMRIPKPKRLPSE
jgi:hypothetical protein